MRRHRIFVAAFAFCAFAGVAAPAWAGVSLVTSRADMGGNDLIDWGTLGLPTLTAIPNPFTISSDGGLSVTVSEQPGSFYSDYEGNLWLGNFTLGDALLYSGAQFGSTGGPIVLNFGNNLVYGGGAQIEPGGYTPLDSPFTATIQAFDKSGASLGIFTESGYATSNEDGSAIFIGVLSTSANIASIAVDVTTPTSFSSDGHDFAINQFTIASPSVPEPSSVILLGLGGTILAGSVLRWRCPA